MNHFLLETSTKQDGNLSLKWGTKDEVQANREAFLRKIGQSLERCIFMELEHGERITPVDASDLRKAISTEALIIAEKEVLLFMVTADCFPVAFHDARRQVVALAHLGWRPTDKRLAAKVIKEMGEIHGSRPEDVEVYIGPGIHKESYVLKDPVQKSMPEWTPFLFESPDGMTHIDLIGHVRQQLMDMGVLEAHIEVSPIDTATADAYFSHYRSVRTGEPEGRFATVVGLR